MALDVYVMPLWRFKAGDFRSPIEETLGIKPTIISLADLPRPRPPWHLRLLAWVGIIEFVEPESPENPAALRASAIREVDDLKEELTKLTGQTVDWQDVGEVVYNKQYHAHDFIKAFAAWYDHRDAMPEFLPADPGHDAGNYPVWRQPEPAQRRFPTLARHSLHTGYLLPVPFAGIHHVEPFKIMGHWDADHDVASSQTVLQEVEDLLLFIADLPTATGSPEHTKYVEAARVWAQELQDICLLSVEHGLPVIFYG